MTPLVFNRLYVDGIDVDGRRFFNKENFGVDSHRTG